MDVVPQNLHWLIPEEAAPCDIFLHFRGQNALGLPRGQIISFEFLGKIAKAQYFQIYIKKEDLPAWESWLLSRHPLSKPNDIQEKTSGKRFGNKRAEFISYFQKSFQLNSSEIQSEKLYKEASDFLQKTIQSSMFDWYFNQFHEPPDLFQHCARVCFSISFFCQLNPLLSAKELEDILQSALIHELSGDLAENLKTVVSTQTIETLEKNKHPVPQSVIDLIRMHDELVSGAGFPKNLKANQIPDSIKIFSLFNLFDHFRSKATGTRRTRFEAAKKQMEKRSADFDPKIWALFWKFWEEQLENIS